MLRSTKLAFFLVVLVSSTANRVDAADTILFGIDNSQVKYDETFLKTAEFGAKERAEELGVDLILSDEFSNAGSSRAKIDILNHYISQGVDAFAITPDSTDDFYEFLESTSGENVGIVAVDRPLEKISLPYVGFDDLYGGRIAAEFICDRARPAGNIVILSGQEGDFTSEQRVDGATETVNKCGLNVISVFAADWETNKAKSTVADLLRQGDRIDAVLAVNDAMALGAIDALKDANKLEDTVVVGFDATPDGANSIIAGELAASVAHDAHSFGRIAIDNAFRSAADEPVFQIAHASTELISNDNIADLPSVRASRIFIGSHEFPPSAFQAYGIVSFPVRATETTRERFLRVCAGYWAALKRANRIPIDTNRQMVTVWPVQSSDEATRLNQLGSQDVCHDAVENYDLHTSETAIHHAEIATGRDFDGRGPFLFAWAPAENKGREGVLVLVVDLSDATEEAHFRDAFQRWKDDIQLNPELWENGWSVEKVRIKLQHLTDRWGQSITAVLIGD